MRLLIIGDLGGQIGAGDEPFYGDLSVDLLPGQPVRIPTVGPGARLLRLHGNPEVPIEVFRDGADNWFVRGNDRVRVHLVVPKALILLLVAPQEESAAPER